MIILHRFTTKIFLLWNLCLLTGGLQLFAQPIARFSAAPLSGCAPILVRFTDESAGNPAYWKWDLGNGTISYVQHPSATYLLPGTYKVTLTVRSSSGQDSLAKTNYIRVIAAPDIWFTASDTSACGPIQVQFTDQTSEGTQWIWDFGDGVFSTQRHPSHTYTQHGNYTVSLKVTNNDGCAAVQVKTAMVKVRPVKAGLAFSNSIRCKPNNFSFTNMSTGAGILRYRWEFGNGDTSTLKDPIYAYPHAGNYRVKLQIWNEAGCNDTASLPVQVQMPLTASFGSQAQLFCQVPAEVKFTAEPAHGYAYFWNFGDSTTSAQPNPTHMYNDTGTYAVSLRIVNSLGCSDSIKRIGYVRITNPTIELLNLTDSGCVPFSHLFEESVISNDTIISREWHFGDGHISNHPTPRYTYSSAGVYNVKLISILRSGCRDTVTVNNAIKAGNKPVAAFTASALSACAQPGIRFTDQSTGLVDAWQWDFGDQITEYVQHPNHIFRDTGKLDVQLIAFSNGCPDTILKRRSVNILPPVSKFKYHITCEDSHRTVFANYSIGADRWQWFLGDGTVSGSYSPVHQYQDTGLYTVRLNVSNNTTGCDFTFSRKLKIASTHSDFFVSDTVGCKNEQLFFRSTLSAEEAAGFIWDFGDGSSVSSNSNQVSHQYAHAGIYTVRLICISLLNCRDTIIKQHHIRIYGLSADFESVASRFCTNERVVFTDHSRTEGGNQIRSWQWNYGDGIQELLTTPPFSHSYAGRGNYNISLLISDDKGCVDSVKLPLPIKVQQPLPIVHSNDTLRCSGDDISLLCPFWEPGVTYRWQLGDGTIDTRQYFKHKYTTPGNYTVKLLVTLPMGCRDSATFNNFIKIEDPLAAFQLSDTFRSCPPLIVDFSNLSTNASVWQWSFGDGSTTSMNAPSHIYGKPGVYLASITVKGRGGCSRKAERRIVVKGPNGSINLHSLSFCKAPALATLRANTHDAISYIWDFNDGVTEQRTDSVVQHVYREPGYFQPKLILTDSNGCRVPISAENNLVVHSLDAAFQIPASLVCNNQSVLFFNATRTTDLVTDLQWDFGDGFYSSNVQNPTHAYALQGTYLPKLVVKTAAGCVDTALADYPLVIAKIKIEVKENQSVCAGQKVRLHATGAHEYAWFPSHGLDNPVSPHPIASPEFTTCYKVIGKDASGCTSDTSLVVVTVNQLPTIDAGPDAVISSGSRLELSPTVSADVIAVNWSPTSSLNRYEVGFGISVLPTVSTVYSAEASNQWGCVARDQVQVRVAATDGGLFIPNSFTPNADGTNDVFYIRSAVSIQVLRMRIFNRAGGTIFERNGFITNDLTSGWDGSFRGATLPQDVYLYTLEIRGIDGKNKIVTGNISLIR